MLKDEITIGIMTYSLRFECFKRLIRQIKSYYPDVEIIVIVNGDYKIEFNPEYRKNMLLFLSEFKNVFPVFFPYFRGISKAWNTIVTLSNNLHQLILNDDVYWNAPDILENIRKNVIDAGDKIRPLNTFSFFYVNKLFLDEIGYFDERLIACGEEDGDMVHRVLLKTGITPHGKFIPGLGDQDREFCDSKPINIKCHNWHVNKPIINRTIISKKYKLLEIGGDKSHESLSSDLRQYPYEKFLIKNYDNIGEGINVDFDESDGLADIDNSKYINQYIYKNK